MITSISDESDQAIDAEGCRQLLAAMRVARVAYVDGGKPHIAVLNYLLDGHDILLQTSDDTRLAALTSEAAVVAVALEVDSISSAGKFGWSVIASGSMSRVASPVTGELPTPWRQGALGVGLRVTVDELTGRKVTAGPVDD